MNERMRDLMPKDYSNKIKREMNGMGDFAKLGFTKPEIGAIAVHQVLMDRTVEISGEEDTTDIRLMATAKFEWTEKRMEGVEKNPNYISAMKKLGID